MKFLTRDISSPNRSLVFSLLLAGVVSSDVLAQNSERRIFQPEDIHQIKSVGDISLSADGEWIVYSVGITNINKDQYSSNLFMVSWNGSTRIQITHSEDNGESNPRFSPDGKYLAFIAARSDGSSEDSDDPKGKSQVWLLNRSGGEARRLTEMPGGVSGFEWSPDSKRLVVVSRDVDDIGNDEKHSTDKEAAEEKGESHDTPKPIVVDRYAFKRDGQDWLGHRRYQRLYVFDLATREAVLLTPGPYDSTQPAWGPDSDIIAFTSKRQGDPDRHDNTDIYVVAAKEGAGTRQVTSWEGPDRNPVFSPDGSKIAYLRDGPPKYAGYDPAQLAVIPVEGGKPFLPTSELDRAMSSPQWSRDGERLYFLLTDDRTRSIVSLPAAGGPLQVMYPTGHPGVVSSYRVSENGIVAVASFGQSPREIYRAGDGVALSDHNKELRESIEWATVEGFDSVSSDGVAVGSILLKPPGYRDDKSYPTIAYVHGGPVGQDGYEFDSISQILAAQGYIVVNPNYRGSNGRGREFSRAIYADWGNLEIKDIHAVIDNLVAVGVADPERLGIGGWSYGGINTNYAIATDTRFKAATSGAAISNMITGYGTDQYIRQYENELGLPWESLDTYLRISYPFLHADRIKTPTLFLCGEKDFNVPLINSEQMYQALRSLNVPTKLVIYPGENHWFSKPSYVQDYLERMIDWYGQYLAAD